MKTLLAAFLLFLSSVVTAAPGYYATFLSSSTGAFLSAMPKGTSGGCFVLPVMAIRDVLSRIDYSAPITVTAIGVNGYWSGKNGASSATVWSGLFYPCENPGFGPLPDMATGVTDPVTTSPIFSGVAGDSSTVEALQSTVTDLQSTIATQQSTLSTLTNAQAEDFDLTTALSAFSFFFGSIVLLWSVAKGGGMVLASIRQGHRW